MRFAHWGFPIRTSPDHRLLATSPTLIAGTPRPSSLLKAKASTIRPYIYPVVDFDNFYYKYRFFTFTFAIQFSRCVPLSTVPYPRQRTRDSRQIGTKKTA